MNPSQPVPGSEFTNPTPARQRSQQMPSLQRPEFKNASSSHAVRSQSFAAASVSEHNPSTMSVAGIRGTSLEPSSMLETGAGVYRRQMGNQEQAGRAVQAVPPFGVREASKIPNDCQVMKQLVREAVVSGQLDNPIASSSDTTESRRPPPAYPRSNNSPQTNQQLTANSNATSPHAHGVPRNQFNFAQHPPRPSSVAGVGQSLQAQQLTQQQMLSSMLQQYQAYAMLMNQTEQQQTSRAQHPQSNKKSKMSISHPDLSRAFSMTSQQQNLYEQQGNNNNINNNNNNNNNVMQEPPRPMDNHHHFLSTPNRYEAMQPRHIVQVMQDRAHSVGPSHLGGGFVPPPPPYFNQQIGLSNVDVDNYMGQRNVSSVVRESADIEARVTSRMVNLLTEENKSLRSELETYIKKTLKLQQLELQYQKIQREYEDLARRQEKRDSLETQMRNKMQGEMERLEKQNQYFKEQLEQALYQLQNYPYEEQEDANELRQEITRLNMLLAQLLPQNKELLACKERQEIELQAQRATLEEQRTHIQILDKALSNAQEKVLRLEEECRKKVNAVSRVERMHETLQKAHADLQKRDEHHKRERAQLQKELAQLQLQKSREGASKKGSNSALRDSDESRLKRELESKEEEILALKKCIVDWEGRFYNEMKSKDRESLIEERGRSERIRQLEEDSEKSEKMMEDTQHENDHYRDRLRDAKNMITAYDSKVKLLEARVIEKDAMIKVLRRQSCSSIEATLADEERNRNSYAGTGKTANDWTSTYSPVDVTRHRLEAVRRRLLQSPSPVRYNRIYHPRMPHSLDTTYGFEDTHSDFSSLERHHAHLRDASDRRYYASGGHHTRSHSSCDPALAALAAKPRQILTLPASVRKNRNNSLLGVFGREGRPKSTDEHLLFPSSSSHTGTSPRATLKQASGKSTDHPISEVGEYDDKTITKDSKVSAREFAKGVENVNVPEKEMTADNACDSPPQIIHV